MTPETFIEHFETFAEAPNGIEKLRELILQLAVQGQLGTHDENDEPAKHSIKAEPKKGKWDVPINDEEVPFQLPATWKWLRLGDISSLKHGYAFSSEFFTNEPAPFVLTTPGNFYEHGGFRDRESTRKYYSGPVDPDFILKPGDLIIPMTEQAAGLLGSPAFIPDDGRVYVHNQRLGKLSFSELVAPEFAYCFFNSQYFRGELARTCTGMKVRHTSPDRILRVLFPLPPLAEQRRIVGKVDQLLGLCDELAARQAARREARSALVGATLDRLVSARDRTSRHRACPGGSTASALLDCAADSTSAKAVEPLGQAQGRLMQDDAHRLRDHFDRLFDTPTTIPQLRQAILQLAVQGQLVPQDPNDEPASVLLNTISTDWSTLATQMKIRSREAIGDMADGSEPFPAPATWKWAMLGCLGITQTGSTPSTQDATNFGDFIAFVKPGDMSPSGIDYANEGLSATGIKNGRLVPAGSVLMVCIGGSIGKAGIVDRDVSCNQQINAMTPVRSIDGKYLLIALRSAYFQRLVQARAGQGTLPILSKSKWEMIPVPVPPLSEQKRIVSKVTELLSLCDALESKLTQAESANTQLLSAAVAHLLQEDSREGAKPQREAAG